MKIYIYLTAALLLLATGCNKNSRELSGIPIKLSVSLENATKATHLSPDSINELDCIIRDQIDASYSYSNTRFLKNGNIWEPETKMLWSSHNTVVDMLFLSPCLAERDIWITDNDSSPMFSWEIESVQTSDSYASDLLMSLQLNSTPNITAYSGVIGVSFKHAMSLLTINIELGTEFNVPSIPADSPIQSLSVGGLKLKGDYYSIWTAWAGGKIWRGLNLVPRSGSEGNVQAYPLSWTPAANAEGHCTAVYECIILPQSGSGMEINVRTGNREFAFTPTLDPSFTFEAGKSYVFNLKVGKNLASMNSVTIYDWNSGAYISSKETD